METKQLVKAITFRLSEEVIRALQRMAATQSRSVNSGFCFKKYRLVTHSIFPLYKY